MPIDQLTPYENNAKIHTEEQIEQIKASITEFGMNDPIAIWGKDNTIIEGHGRLIACKELGMAEVPVIRLDSLSDEQRRAYTLVHNQTTMSTGFDIDILNTELDNIDLDMSVFGFDIELDPIETEPILEDTVPENAETRCKYGDLWQLGDHRLICGDSTDKHTWDKLMNGEKADMVFTDPPYGVAIGDKNASLNEVQESNRITDNISNDTLSEDELYEMLKSAFINVRENCNDDAVYYVTSPQGGSLGLMMMMMMMRDAGLEVRHVLMWKKNTATFSIGRLDYDYQHEPIFYTWTTKHHNYRGGEYRTTVWEYDKPRANNLHPTMKPVELVANAIKDGTIEGMSVIDAFGGSGTTLIACEQLNRKCYMAELDPHYCDVIIQRWENLTGKKAVKLGGAE